MLHPAKRVGIKSGIPNGIQDAVVDSSSDGGNGNDVHRKNYFRISGDFFEPLLIGYSF